MPCSFKQNLAAKFHVEGGGGVACAELLCSRATARMHGHACTAPHLEVQKALQAAHCLQAWKHVRRPNMVLLAITPSGAP